MSADSCGSMSEIVASNVEMLSGRKKKDYEAQQAADSLAAQASVLGEAAPDEPIPDTAGFDTGSPDEDDDLESDEVAA